MFPCHCVGLLDAGMESIRYCSKGAFLSLLLVFFLLVVQAAYISYFSHGWEITILHGSFESSSLPLMAGSYVDGLDDFLLQITRYTSKSFFISLSKGVLVFEQALLIQEELSLS